MGWRAYSPRGKLAFTVAVVLGISIGVLITFWLFQALILER